jgi:hypothetical protein
VHGNAEAAGVPGGDEENSVMSLGDAFDDHQAESDTFVIGAYAFSAPLKRFYERGHSLWGELLSGVLDSEQHAVAMHACRGRGARLRGGRAGRCLSAGAGARHDVPAGEK